MTRTWWRVPALASGLVMAGAGTAAATAPPSTPVVDSTTTTVAAAAPTPSLALSVMRPARYGSVVASLSGCAPGGLVRLWHHAVYVERPGTTHEAELELYEITDVTCGADGVARATFVAGQQSWEDPSRTLTGGVVEATLDESSAPVAQVRYEIARPPAPDRPAGPPATGALPPTGSSGTLAVVAALSLVAGIALVRLARRRPI